MVEWLKTPIHITIKLWPFQKNGNGAGDWRALCEKCFYRIKPSLKDIFILNIRKNLLSQKQFYMLIVSIVRGMMLLRLKRIILMWLLHLMMMLIKSLFQKDMGILEVKWNYAENTTQKRQKNSFVLSTAKNYSMKIDTIPVNKWNELFTVITSWEATKKQ